MSGFPPASRLFAAPDPGLAAHLDCFGEPPAAGPELIAEVDAAGLRGRGGAGFPTSRKMAAVTGPKPVVVGNGAEGEPLSRKDVQLLTQAPHLVLDGLGAAAAAVGADKVYLYVHADSMPWVKTALDERRASGMEPRKVEVVEAPDRFVAGEESAAIRRIEGGSALPRDRTVVTAVSGVRGRPTLVNNVETLAHIALIARYGSEWFRSAGDSEMPGTMLATLSGALNRHGVVEIPTGTTLEELIDLGGGTDVSAALIGGYHGTWVPAQEFATTQIGGGGPGSPRPGSGIVHALAATECGVARTAEITKYLAEQSARQCGPCLNGLPRLAQILDDLAFGRATNALVTEALRVAQLVEGRGSCRHPDGTARMLRSALTVFADDIQLHRRKRCSAADAVASA